MKDAFKAIRDVKLVKYTNLLKTVLLDFFLLLVDMQVNGMSCMELLLPNSISIEYKNHS